ncbi:MAG: hypothetical protein JWO78_3 [Micavibrio sp.]|nr:hypothetical protein [Micavibrio sp.]
MIKTASPDPDKELRRANKAERRRKQREANAGRVLKMRKARLAHTEKKSDLSAPPIINVGCSGWFYWHWRGVFYPDGMPTKEWFGHYSSNFKTVELNAPFYSWPTLANVASWKKQAGRKKFIYTVKVSELITHIKRFSGTKVLTKDFSYIADLLGERMGCFIFQTPPSFHYTPTRLKAIVAQLDPRYRNVVEFRHASWWNDDVYKAFKKAGIIFCSCSGPKLPDDLIATADDVYIRFHGKAQWYRYNYSRVELTEWAKKAKACGAKRIWAYFNNDMEGHAIKNAKTFSALLRKEFVTTPQQET